MKYLFFPDGSAVPIFWLGATSDLLGRRSSRRWKSKRGWTSGAGVDGMGASGSSAGLSAVAEIFWPIMKCGENNNRLSIRIGDRCGNRRNKTRIECLSARL